MFEDSKMCHDILFSGHDKAVTIMGSQEPWLLSLGMHNAWPVYNQLRFLKGFKEDSPLCRTVGWQLILRESNFCP